MTSKTMFGRGWTEHSSAQICIFHSLVCTEPDTAILFYCPYQQEKVAAEVDAAGRVVHNSWEWWNALRRQCTPTTRLSLGKPLATSH